MLVQGALTFAWTDGKQATRAHQLLATFQEAWPVDDLIHQYIENHRSHQLRKVGSIRMSQYPHSHTVQSIAAATSGGDGKGPQDSLSPVTAPTPPQAAFGTPSLPAAAPPPFLPGMPVPLADVVLEAPVPVRGGSYADVFPGSWRGARVALKRVRAFAAASQQEVSRVPRPTLEISWMALIIVFDRICCA